MAQISSIGSAPDPISNIPSAALKTGSASTNAKAAQQSDEAQVSPLQAQLVRFGSVLNGLQQNANLSRAQYVQAYNKVKSGSYTVNPRDVSRSLVNDMLTKQ